MRWDVALALRLIIHATAALLALVVALIGVAIIVVALFGTGAFTADPPPDHPNFLAAGIVVIICTAVESSFFWAWRGLVRMVNTAEAS